jgi:hypothetical protein
MAKPRPITIKFSWRSKAMPTFSPKGRRLEWLSQGVATRSWKNLLSRRTMSVGAMSTPHIARCAMVPMVQDKSQGMDKQSFRRCGARVHSIGAGIASIDNAAAFIKANMPLGRGGTLTDQEAWDVAAYVDGHERPQDPRFTGSVETTRRKYHDTPMSEYGQTVGVLLGQNSPPSGIINAP